MPAPTLNFLHTFPKAKIVDFDIENNVIEFKIKSLYDIKLTTDSIVLPIELSWPSNGVKKEFNERFFIPIEDSKRLKNCMIVKCRPIRDEKIVENALGRIGKENSNIFMSVVSMSNSARCKQRERNQKLQQL